MFIKISLDLITIDEKTTDVKQKCTISTRVIFISLCLNINNACVRHGYEKRISFNYVIAQIFILPYFCIDP